MDDKRIDKVWLRDGHNRLLLAYEVFAPVGLRFVTGETSVFCASKEEAVRQLSAETEIDSDWRA